jgi:hypothetical protein
VEDNDKVAEAASVIDAIQNLGNGNASTNLGALEAHSMKISESLDGIAAAIEDLAAAIDRLSIGSK